MYKNRGQKFNQMFKRWVKLDTETGMILSVKCDKKPYKNVEILPDYREKAKKHLYDMGWTLEEIAKHMKL